MQFNDNHIRSGGSVMSQHATLIVTQPGHKTLSVEISDGVTSIGRAEGNSVRLRHDRNVSRHHAEITLRDDGYWLSDLGTRNGTTVNENFIESEQKLARGDVIRLGGTSSIEFTLPTHETVDAGEVVEQRETPAVNVETARVAEAAAVPAPAGSPSTFLVTILGIVGGVVLISIFGGILFASGLINAKKSYEPTAKDVGLPTQQSPSPSNDDGDVLSSPTPEPQPTEIAVTDPTPNVPVSGAPAGDAQILAAKISPKNYKFDPAFVVLIGAYVNEYSAGGYYARAKSYREVIDKEFVNVQGLPPIFGYVMAMSRTKLVEANGDVWSLPQSVIKAESGASSDSGPSDPARSTKMAASYIRGLWDVFGKEGFMYVVACYGMTLDEAGQVQQQLEIKDPTGQVRYDFWRMKSMGVVNGEQVERVARFFAAGIVIENPQQFGLNEPPLSTLY